MLRSKYTTTSLFLSSDLLKRFLSFSVLQSSQEKTVPWFHIVLFNAFYFFHELPKRLYLLRCVFVPFLDKDVLEKQEYWNECQLNRNILCALL